MSQTTPGDARWSLRRHARKLGNDVKQNGDQTSLHRLKQRQGLLNRGVNRGRHLQVSSGTFCKGQGHSHKRYQTHTEEKHRSADAVQGGQAKDI